MEQYAVLLIEALSRLWMRIRLNHPDVPPVVLLPAPAPRGEMNVLGHFAALRWSGPKAGDEHLHEVVVVAEHLNRPAEAITETLLHEAAHAVNCNRRITDCSVSQYHNKRFKAAAEELGLVVEQVKHYGFALTKLPPETAALYAAETAGLRQVLIHRRRPPSLPKGPDPPGTGDDPDDGDTKPRSRLLKAVCACGFIIRVSKKTFTDTTIHCGNCEESFRLA